VEVDAGRRVARVVREGQRHLMWAPHCIEIDGRRAWALRGLPGGGSPSASPPDRRDSLPRTVRQADSRAWR